MKTRMVVFPVQEWFVAARNNHKILAWYNQPNISSGNRELGNLKLIQLSHVKVLKKSLTMKKVRQRKSVIS